MKPLLLPALIVAMAVACHPSTVTNTAPASATNAPAGSSTNAVAAKPSTVAPAPPPELPLPAQEVVRLSQTSVGEGVVIAFIESLKDPFTLNADHIIFLSDLGLGTPVISALVKKAGTSATPASAIAAPVQPEAKASAPTTSPLAQGATTTTAASSLPNAEAAPATNASLAALPVPGAPQPQPPAPVYGPAQAAPPPPSNPPATVMAAPAQPVTYSTFYDSLAPYGNWVLLEPYGWCWQPAVVAVTPSWRPYCDGGRWLWTDYGWYWQSTYTWGWAPFHYGRWHQSARLGWVWAPGYDWGPAWVSWRYSNAYCGWAPLPPECRWSAGVGFSWVSGGLAVSVGFGILNNGWYGCSWNNFCSPHLPRWGIGHSAMGHFVQNSQVAVGGDRSINVAGNNNTVIVNNGVPLDKVQAHSRDEVRKHAVAEATSPSDALRASRPGATMRPEVAAYRPTMPASGQGLGVASAPSASVLGRQESRKAPGVTAASLPARPMPGSSGFANTMPNAMPPVPGILGATAPAASRPAPARPGIGLASPGSGPAARPSIQPTFTPGAANPSPARPAHGVVSPPTTLPAHPTPTAPASSPATTGSPHSLPTRPVVSYPGSSPAPEGRPGTPRTESASPTPGPTTIGNGLPGRRSPTIESSGTLAPPRPAPVNVPHQDVPVRFPGANLGSVPTAPVSPRGGVGASSPTAPTFRRENTDPSTPFRGGVSPSFPSRPEPRSLAPSPTPSPMPSPAMPPAGMRAPQAPYHMAPPIRGGTPPIQGAGMPAHGGAPHTSGAMPHGNPHPSAGRGASPH